MKRTVILLSLVGIAAVTGVGNLAGGDAAQSTSFRLVRRGRPVAQLDTTLPAQAVRQAQADVASAPADAARKKLPLTQATALNSYDAITEPDYRAADYASYPCAVDVEHAVGGHRGCGRAVMPNGLLHAAVK